jgi:hypothetical protein
VHTSPSTASVRGLSLERWPTFTPVSFLAAFFGFFSSLGKCCSTIAATGG